MTRKRWEKIKTAVAWMIVGVVGAAFATFSVMIAIEVPGVPIFFGAVGAITWAVIHLTGDDE